MLADWPALADVGDEMQAGFIAGYMTHLIMDQAWVEMIVMPALFIDGTVWGTEHPNWRLYCILMTYLEYRAGARLPAGTTGLVASARPEQWLPFVADSDLARWGSHVARIIEQGGPRLVSSGLAKTCHMLPDEMEAIVLAEEAMRREAYTTVPRARLADFESETTRRCQETVAGYLSHHHGE